MAENYFYSSLSAQEIEDTLVGAVRYNTDQTLTTTQKRIARQNIGAGEADSTFKILGFFDTYQDLVDYFETQIPEAGDAYCVGTASPYDVYIYDGVHNEWVNNGPIEYSDALIDDGDISTTSTWSSNKINAEIGAVSTAISTGLASKQDKITASGILKGDGNGGVSAAVAGTDYLTPATSYSPIKRVNGDLPSNPYYITAGDAGKTIVINWMQDETLDRRLVLTLANSSQMPVGTEIAIVWLGWANSVTIAFQDNIRVSTPGNNVAPGLTVKIGETGMVAIKKVFNTDGGGNDMWIIAGNVEVVS